MRGSVGLLRIFISPVQPFLSVVRALFVRRVNPKGVYWSVPWSITTVEQLLDSFAGCVYELSASVLPMEEWLDPFRRHLRVVGYSPRTIRSYFGVIVRFLAWARKPPGTLEGRDAELYLRSQADRDRSSSTINVFFSALRLYLEWLDVPFSGSRSDLVRPSKDRRSPHILSMDEAAWLIAAPSNLKQR